MSATLFITTVSLFIMQLRPIQITDWPNILAIQSQCYTELEPESLAVLQNKVTLCPQGCFVAEHESDILGYCLAHPWVKQQFIALDSLLEPSVHADILYLHDMALAPKAQGLGLGKRMFAHLQDCSHSMKLHGISLVAVQGAQAYWARLGFSSMPLTHALEGYPQGACYMHLANHSLDRE
jgi:ribosomal protein S18 acetylase RimI-like enzyme